MCEQTLKQSSLSRESILFTVENVIVTSIVTDTELHILYIYEEYIDRLSVISYAGGLSYPVPIKLSKPIICISAIPVRVSLFCQC